MTHSAQNCFSSFHQHFFLFKSVYFPSTNTLERPIEGAFYLYKQVHSVCTCRVCMLGHNALLLVLCLDLWPFSPHICCGMHTLMNHIIHWLYTNPFKILEILKLSVLNKLLSVWGITGLMVLRANCTCYG